VLLVGALEGFSVTVVGLALSVGGKVGAFVGVPVGAPVGLGVGKTQEPVLPEKLQRFVFFGPFLLQITVYSARIIKIDSALADHDE